MFKLLLVDDEPMIRKGMLTCIDWTGYGVEIVGEANNGAVALEKALALKPHIVVTDIRMPVMDGIEFCHKLRKQLPDCKIIIMSGYDDFSYARSLMSLKVTDYLLKPVLEEELVAALDRIKREIKEETLKKTSTRLVDELLIKNLPHVKSDFIRKLLDGTIRDKSEMAMQASILNFRIPQDDCVFVMIVANIEGAAETSHRDLERVKYSVVNIAEEIINQTFSGMLCYSGFDRVIGLIRMSGRHPEALERLFGAITGAVKTHLKLNVTIGAGTPERDVEKINESYIAACADLDNKLFHGKKGFVKTALRYIEENYNKNITLSEVAQAAYVTPNYLSKIFKQEMNTNFVDWLNRLRVEKAKELLLSTNLKTYEIADQVGYRDHKYFSSTFKKNTGFTPKEYAKRAADSQ